MRKKLNYATIPHKGGNSQARSGLSFIFSLGTVSNIGFEDTEKLMQACRLIRLEAPLYLALSASSPFIDGKATGYHSTRWAVFPQTPSYVPLFEDHDHHIHWVNEQLNQGTMQNVRHLWLSVRPNGDHRPYNLNRLELRICDLIVDPIAQWFHNSLAYS